MVDQPLCPLCKAQPDSHEHLFFKCSFSSRVWDRLKVFTGMPNIPSDLNDIVECIKYVASSHSIRSVVCKLVFAASCYFIWQERNGRLFKKIKRSQDQIFELIKTNVRIKLLTCSFKKTLRDQQLVDIWKLPSTDVAATGVEGNILGGNKSFDKLNIDGKYKVRRKVSMNPSAMVWEVEETDFASPLRGADIENVGMESQVGGLHSENQKMEGNITRMELDKLVADENRAGNEADGCEEVRSSTTDGTQSMDSPTVEDTKVVDDEFVSQPGERDANVNLNIEYDCSNEAATWNSTPNDATSGLHMDNTCSNEAAPTPNAAATGPNNFPHSKPVSFASILNSEQVNKKLNFRSFVNEERVENSDTVLPKAAMERVKNRYVNSLVGYFVGKNLAFPVVQNYVNNTWGKFGLQKVMRNDDGVLCLNLLLKKSQISFARALIEVSSEFELKSKVTMAIPNEAGDGYTKEVIRVEYEWKPPHCGECKIFGHDLLQCPKHVKETIFNDPSTTKHVGTSTTMDTSSDGFTEVTRKKNKGTNKSGADLATKGQMGTNSAINKANGLSTSNSFDILNKVDIGDDCGISSSTASEHTPSMWNKDFESDDEVDEVIFPEGNKWDDQFNIRFKEKTNRNVIRDSSNMCDNEGKAGQNVDESEDERVVLASLTANLKLDIDENKMKHKKLKKANMYLSQELEKSKQDLFYCRSELKNYKNFQTNHKDKEKPELECQKALGFLYVQSLEKEVDDLQKNFDDFKSQTENENVSSRVDDLLLQECLIKDILCSIENADLKAQLQDKANVNAELRNLLNKTKGKFVDTKFKKPSVVRQPNAFKFSKPSIMGKPSPFSNSLERQFFPKSRFAPNTNEKKDLSKLVTPQILSQRDTQKQVVRHSNYINDVNAITKKPKTVPISARKSTKNANQSVATSHKITIIVQIILFIIDSGCTKHMTGNLKLLCNFVEKYLGTVRFDNDQYAPILRYRDLVQGNVMIKRVYYAIGLNKNLFFVGQFCDTDLGFMAKASPTQAWLWHRRLSHLNFETINLLLKNHIVNGLPKLKYVRINCVHLAKWVKRREAASR
ncbi:retrovirus-related pol polyprotein from transposon TNT 1-94 [Tanacetum coccineum]